MTFDEWIDELRKILAKDGLEATDDWIGAAQEGWLAGQGQKQDRWQPIETAPKDGTEFDVWCPSPAPGDNGGYRIANCWWCRVDLRFRAYGDERMAWAHQPTHWMPLPDPPA